ncbi:MAG: hypothetical protein M3Y19_09505, partial [Actinomycetota bacterium]|nr:hypothetical protein [Actinomycetota bacterium]
LGIRYGTVWIGANLVFSGLLILGALAAMVYAFWRLSLAQNPADAIAPNAIERRCADQRS